MERISLVHGLDQPDDRPAVDILVPDGRIDDDEEAGPGVAFEATLSQDGNQLTGPWMQMGRSNSVTFTRIDGPLKLIPDNVSFMPDSAKPEERRTTGLANALDDLLAGKLVSNQTTRAFGCTIKWKS